MIRDDTYKRVSYLIDPVSASLAGSLGSSAVGALGSILGFGSNKSANATNLKIAQMNNEFNESMLNKQMAYNTDMWNKENEYNTASNQRKRLEAAGLNPYLMMSGGSAGTASSALGVNTPSASEVGKQNAYDPSGSFAQIGAGVSQLSQIPQVEAQVSNLEAQTRKTNNESDQVAIDNMTRNAQNIASLNNLLAQTKNEDSKRILNDVIKQVQEFTLGLNRDTRDAQVQTIKYNAMKTGAEGFESILRSGLLRKQIKWFDKQQIASLKEIVARTYASYKSGELSAAQAKTEAKKQAILSAEGYVAEHTKDYKVKQSLHESNTAQNTDRDTYNKGRYGLAGQAFGQLATDLIDMLIGDKMGSIK